jgi:hypothetical protein
MPTARVRDLTPAEEATVEGVLRRLREHYPKSWPGCIEGHEYDLMGFAYYEGCGHRWECCREILAEAAPFALGRELVAKHGFRWVMIRSGRSWGYGVEHPALDRPIDLDSLEDGPWNEEEYDQPPCPGRMTHDSLETIVRRLREPDRGASRI